MTYKEKLDRRVSKSRDAIREMQKNPTRLRLLRSWWFYRQCLRQI